MTILISCATGNWTAAGTWAAVDATSYLNSESGNTVVPVSPTWQASTAFTPGAITVDGVALKLSSRSASPSGTLTVDLYNSSLGASVTSVTVNVSDLPNAASSTLGGWIFFKFSTPQLLLVATNYQIRCQSSVASMVYLFRDATTGNWSRMLRTTTTQAPVAGDMMHVIGELTGVGTGNDIAVTMDETAATDYGDGTTSATTASLTIGTRGTLTYGTTAATNYVLRLSGVARIYMGGTFSIGTTGTPIPRDSTAVLEFDCAADGDFGLYCYGTFTSQGLSRTIGKDIDRCLLNTDEAANSTSLGVDIDTGWLDNDEIIIATTTRTLSESEGGTLNGNAGASSLTVDGFAGAAGGLLYAHSGSSPTQAEVALLTRNVIIRSTSASQMAYVSLWNNATVDCDWTRFQYLGANFAGKYGIYVAAGAISIHINRCSLTDCERYGLYTDSGASGVTFQNNIVWNCNAAGGGSTGPIHVLATTSTTNLIAGNLVIKTPAYGMFLGDNGGAITNNTIVASVYLSETAPVGTFTGNTIHCGSLLIIANGGTISDLTIWRSPSIGITSPSWCANVIFDNLTLFGNLSGNIATYRLVNCTFKNVHSNGDTTFATVSGIHAANSSMIHDVTFIDCDFSVASGIKTAHTQDILLTEGANVRITLINTSLDAATEVGVPTAVDPAGYISSQKHDQTAGLHKTWKRYGIWITDTTIHDGSPSMRMTPNSASSKFESPAFRSAVSNGNTLTVSVKVRESVVGDGTDYNGNRIRLIVKASSAAGISADTVLDTATISSEGAWETLSGTTASVTDDAVLEFVVDCDGTTGWINVDTFAVTSQVDTRTFKYWAYGAPVVYGDNAAGGGGYTYGDEDPIKVLTTATGAGTYQAVAASAVQKGVAVGISPAVGTLVGVVDSSGTLHVYGTCSNTQTWAVAGIVHTDGETAVSGILNSSGIYAASGVFAGGSENIYATSGLINTQVQSGLTWNDGDGPHAGILTGCVDAVGVNQGTPGILDASGAFHASGTLSSANEYNATGVIYGAGLYATEASRNSTTAGADQILTGYSVTIAGVTTNGMLDLSLYALIAGITWPALEDVDGGVQFGPVTGLEYEGTGMTAAEVQNAITAALASGVNTVQLAGQGVNAAGTVTFPASVGTSTLDSTGAQSAAAAAITAAGVYTGTPPTADAIGTDAASKVLATPANKLVTNASGQVETSNGGSGSTTGSIFD